MNPPFFSCRHSNVRGNCVLSGVTLRHLQTNRVGKHDTQPQKNSHKIMDQEYSAPPRTRSSILTTMSLSKKGMPPHHNQERASPPCTSVKALDAEFLTIGKKGMSEYPKEGHQSRTTANISLCVLVKYNGINCAYALDFESDKRILNLKILPNKVSFPHETDIYLENTIVGKRVEPKFECKNGSKSWWRGLSSPRWPSWRSGSTLPMKKTWSCIFTSLHCWLPSHHNRCFSNRGEFRTRMGCLDR